MTARIRFDPEVDGIVWIEDGRFSLRIAEKLYGHSGSRREIEIVAYPDGTIFQVKNPAAAPTAWPQDAFSIEEIHELLPEGFALIEAWARDVLTALGFSAHDQLPLIARIRACAA